MPLQQQSLLCPLTQGKSHCSTVGTQMRLKLENQMAHRTAKWQPSWHPKWSVSGFILWISWEAAMRIKSLWTPYPWADGVSRVAGKQRTICTSKDPEASELWNVPSICIKTTFFLSHCDVWSLGSCNSDHQCKRIESSMLPVVWSCIFTTIYSKSFEVILQERSL